MKEKEKMKSTEDDRINLYDIIITENLKKGDLVQIKYLDKIINQYIVGLDENSAVEKFTLIETRW